MSVVYWFLSLLASFVHEASATVLASRSKTLRRAIERLLEGDATKTESLTKKLYSHSLIQGLGLPKFGAATAGESSPSYIPSKIFALALLNAIGGVAPTVDAIRTELDKYPDAKKVLDPMLTVAGTDVAKLGEELAHWFDRSMERVSAWYKRRAAVSIFVIATLITIGGNFDTLHIGTALWHGATVRDAVVAAAGSAQGHAPADIASSIDALDALQIPAGWPLVAPHAGWTWGAYGLKAIGWILTILAISVGAPFWFDMLSKVSQFGGNGTAPDRAPPPAVPPKQP